MKDSHKKIKSWYNHHRRAGYGSSLLLRNGDIIPCDGVTHEQICRVAGTTLGAFLEDGGVRFFGHRHSCSVEASKPVNTKLIGSIRRLLKTESWESATFSIAGKRWTTYGNNIGLRSFNHFLSKHPCTKK